MQDDNVRDATLRILQNIQSQLGELRTQVASELGQVRSRLDRLESSMAVQFDEVRGEIYDVRDEVQALRDEMRVGFKASFKQNDRRFVDHEGRLRALERRR